MSAQMVKGRPGTVPGSVHHDNTFISIDPGMKSGSPCIAHNRLPVYLVAGVVWEHGMAEAIASYDITREQVLTACWFVGAYGIDGIGRRRLGGDYRISRGGWRKRWGRWAAEQHMAIWGGMWHEVVDPPTKADE